VEGQNVKKMEEKMSVITLGSETSISKFQQA